VYSLRVCTNLINSIVSSFPNETTKFGPQTFIVRILIIINTGGHHIYTQIERRGKGLAAGETERESVREMESG
jgi:hypothetical protein